MTDNTAAPGGLVSSLAPDEIKAGIMELALPADEALKHVLKSRVPLIEEAAGYVIFSGGKRLRPALFQLSTRALGGELNPRLASITEFLHAASLLHDDVVDEAGLRRGRPAARVKYGNDAVILVGDFLFSISYLLASESPDRRIFRAMADCTTRMAEGQVLELMHTGNTALDRETYIEVIRAKTAVLLACSCQMGAMHAGAGEKLVDAFYQYGMELGLAFQMIDDALDYVGTEHEFGKPVGHDLEEGKITLPFIHARETLPAGESARLVGLAAQGGQPGLDEAKELVRQSGGVEVTYQQAALHARAAQVVLDRALGQDPPRDLELLKAISWYVIHRRS